MDIESKIWTYAGTGTKVHAFIDGVALCRKNLRNDPARVERMGHDYSGAVHYAMVCSSCEKKFNAAIERLEDSLKPSTGEGDYLPPAEDLDANYDRVISVMDDLIESMTPAEESPEKETVIESKIWNFSGTGTKVHAFNNGAALCRKNIKDSEISRPNHKDYCQAKTEVRRAPGTAICTACDTKFNAAVERLENSLKPSTGEGDYLPPAEEKENNVTEPEDTTVEGTFHTYLKITPEVIQALANVRAFAAGQRRDVAIEINILDNAGVFAPIDEVTGYDVDPAPEPVSKCTCANPELSIRTGLHALRCPGDPAEWGDLAYTGAKEPVALRIKDNEPLPAGRRYCPADQCTLAYKVNKNGTLHKHLNDMYEPCPGVAPTPKEN